MSNPVVDALDELLALYPFKIDRQAFVVNGGAPLTADGDDEFLSFKKVDAALGEIRRLAEQARAALSAVTAERDRLREQVAALQSDANSWQSGYDKGREDGAKSAGGWRDQHARDSAELRRLCAGRDHLRAEVEALREALDHIGGLSRALRAGGPDPMDLEGLSDALNDAVDTAHAAMAAKVGAQ